ncbi:hypothetical protein [Caulobacter sp. UNC279MFTsu5.1]|uniref:hypothetical protein n=1 Tax=Caulobacter sp. UNC279MFTsu5.1 TaxID=1502775 RepID=UPI000382B23C|nr:hypothetical protein [Caulobacter sp. UNC279MFTsu5.1]SFI94154.1 hypothetical protein SAMN02799626_00830 [Caulobacter sp. UNC279MFTsu5.1]
MTNDAEPIAKPYRLHIAATVIVAGLLWLADGRLWPSISAYAGDAFWLVMLLQLVLGSWLAKSRPGRILAVFLYGAFLWLAAEGICRRAAESSEERSMVLAGGALALALVAASVAWDRLPSAWRARMAASPIWRRVGGCLLFGLTGGALWGVMGAITEGDAPWTRVHLTALFLAMGGGLVLVLWRLDGWVRAFACWAVASLTWVPLMTGLGLSGSPAEIGVGGWLLAVVPPLIGGAVLLANFRISRRHRL